ncbi:hypothetical protein RR48_00437 [Papilio machaon]|uniref:Uncharacterized protein n=1 Tax=Papilio machaon TaxID=76193 RepID=A0A0N0PFJ2_PAPMA|nr:hypothetical protein RR48_00437 [Papilio machaon]
MWRFVEPWFHRKEGGGDGGCVDDGRAHGGGSRERRLAGGVGSGTQAGRRRPEAVGRRLVLWRRRSACRRCGKEKPADNNVRVLHTGAISGACGPTEIRGLLGMCQKCLAWSFLAICFTGVLLGTYEVTGQYDSAEKAELTGLAVAVGNMALSKKRRCGSAKEEVTDGHLVAVRRRGSSGKAERREHTGCGRRRGSVVEEVTNSHLVAVGDMALLDRQKGEITLVAVGDVDLLGKRWQRSPGRGRRYNSAGKAE